MSCYVVSRLGSSAGLGAGPGPGLGRHLSRPTLQTVLATHFQDNKLKVSPTCQLRRTCLATCLCIVSISTQLKVLHSLVKVSSNATIIITSAIVVSMPSFVLAAGWMSARCRNTEIDTDSAACQLDIGGGSVSLVQYLPSHYPHIPRIIRNGRLGSLPLPILLGAASPGLGHPLKPHWTRPLS